MTDTVFLNPEIFPLLDKNVFISDRVYINLNKIRTFYQSKRTTTFNIFYQISRYIFTPNNNLAFLCTYIIKNSIYLKEIKKNKNGGV